MNKLYRIIKNQNISQNAIFSIALYYKSVKNYKEMIKYYLIGVENNYTPAMINLGNYYYEIGDINNMIKYFLMPIKFNDTTGLFNIGYYYDINNNTEQMIKYYNMAIKYNNPLAIHNLGIYYEKIGNIKEAEKLYLLGIKNTDNINFLINLVDLYINNKQFSNLITLYFSILKNHDKYIFLLKNKFKLTIDNSNSLYLLILCFHFYLKTNFK